MFTAFSVSRNPKIRGKAFAALVLEMFEEREIIRTGDMLFKFRVRYNRAMKRETAKLVLDGLVRNGKIKLVEHGCYCRPNLDPQRFELDLLRSEAAQKIFDRLVQAKGLSVNRRVLVADANIPFQSSYAVLRRLIRHGLIYKPRRDLIALAEEGERFAGLLPAHTPAHTSAPAEVDIFS